MKIAIHTALAVAFLTTACAPGKDENKTEQTNAAGENPLTAPADYVGAVAASKRTAVRVVDLASVQQAIQMFAASEGRYPANLNELVTEKYLPRLPELPTGLAYQYDAKTGQVQAAPK